MKNILIADFKRILKDKLIIVMTIIAAALAIIYPLLMIVVDASFEASMEEMSINGVNSHMYASTDMLITMLTPNGLVGLVIPLLSAVLIFKDHTSGIIRNKIITGSKRKTILLAAFIENVIVTLVFTLGAALIAFAFSSLFLPITLSEESTGFIIKEVVLKILVSILCLVFLCSLSTLFVTGLRNLALAIIIPYVLMFVGDMIVTAATLIITFNGDINYELWKTIECFNFLGAWDSLINAPSSSVYYLSSLKDGKEVKTLFDTIHIISYTMFPLGFSALNVFLGTIAIEKKDIK